MLRSHIFNPTYGSVDLSFRTPGTDNFVFKSAEEWYGVYFQDQLKFFDGQVQVLGGGRYDWTKYGTLCCNISVADNDVDNTISEKSFSPRVGVVYHPWQWLSLYGNYVESFGTNNGRSATGEPFDPEGATQYEAGIKTELWEGRFSSTLAFFHLTKENILTADITTLDRFDSIAIGEARSQGIELDLSGQLTDSLSLIASYAYTDTRITQDDRGNEGHRLPNVPDHSGSAWLKYELLESPVRGLSLGTGVFLASQREGDNENSFELPGYVRWDAMATYRFNVGKSRLTAQVNVNNILDKEYFEHSDTFNGIPRFNIFPAEPLTVLGSIRVEF
ncbi:MAG: TonB-dependent siderophore receptor [Gammaproteobacteria bacterium]